MKCPKCSHSIESHKSLEDDEDILLGCSEKVGVASVPCSCLFDKKDIYEALLAEAREVIAPFAKVADDWFPELSDDNDVKTIVGSNENPVTIGQFRKAVSFLAKIGNGDME